MKNVLRIGARCALVTIIGAVIIGRWLAPAFIRSEIMRALSGYWDGPIRLADVEVNYFGPLYLRGLRLSDKAGRECVSADMVTIKLANWPSYRPEVTKIEVSALRLRISAAGGKSALPLARPSAGSSKSNKKFGLQKLTIREATIVVTGEDGAETTYDGLRLSVARNGNTYHALLSRTVPTASELLVARARIDSSTLLAEGALHIEHSFDQAEMAILLSLLNISDLSTQGSITANLKIAGNLEKPETLRPKGTVEFEDWAVLSKDGTTVNQFSTQAKFDGGQVWLENLAVQDANGAEWFSARSSKLIVKNWPGSQPVLTEIDVLEPKLEASLVDGRLVIPATLPFHNSYPPESKYVDLQKVTLRGASVSISSGQAPRVTFDGLCLEAGRREQWYDIQLRRAGPDDCHQLSAAVTLDPTTSEFDLSLRADTTVREDEMAVVFSALSIPGLSAHGRLVTDLQIAGCYGEPETLKSKGIVKLRDWIMASAVGGPSHNFVADIKLDDRRVWLENLAVRDANGLEWFSAETSELTLMNWPGRQPVLTEIDISGLKVEASLVDGRVKVPAVLPVGGSEQAKKGRLDLQRLTVRDALVGITDPNGSRMTFDNLGLQLARRQDCYDIQFTRSTPTDSNELTAAVTFNPTTSDLELSLQAEMTVGAAELTAVLSALKIPHFSAQGRLTTDLMIVGCLNEPETLRPKGLVKLRDWVVASKDGSGSNSLSTDVRVDGSELRLEHLAIRDANDREWFSAETSKVALENWPGSRPVLTEIETEGLAVRGYIIEGKLRLPVEFSASESAGLKSNYLNLQKLVVRNASLGMVDRPGSKIACDYLSLRPAEREGFYDILLTCNKPQEVSRISLKGLVNPASTEIRLSLETDHRARKQATAVVFAALGMPQVSAEGNMIADLTIAGHLNEPLGLQSNGSIRFDECVLFFRDKVLAKNLVAAGKLDGQSLNVDKFTAVVCGGQVSASFYAEVQQNHLMEFRGRILAVNVNFPEFTSVLAANANKAARGTFTASYDFAGQRNDLNVLNGKGLIFFDDADISVLPVIPQIFRFIGLSQHEPLKMSDAEAIFSTSGPVVTIQSGHIANRYAAIEFEPGGIINLQTEKVDGYVVVAPLGQITRAVESLPIINIFANLKDKLARLHLKGRWSDPPADLIKKKPIEDIRDGTVGFIQDVVKSGGQMTRSVLDKLGALFQNKQRKGD